MGNYFATDKKVKNYSPGYAEASLFFDENYLIRKQMKKAKNNVSLKPLGNSFNMFAFI